MFLMYPSKDGRGAFQAQAMMTTMAAAAAIPCRPRRSIKQGGCCPRSHRDDFAQCTTRTLYSDLAGALDLRSNLARQQTSEDVAPVHSCPWDQKIHAWETFADGLKPISCCSGNASIHSLVRIASLFLV